MSTITLGTAGTTTLVALVWTGSAAQADVAAINSHILDDVNTRHPAAQIGGGGGFVREGLLYVPNRGILTLRASDVVAYDPATGWPILLSSRAAAGASWVHS